MFARLGKVTFICLVAFSPFDDVHRGDQMKLSRSVAEMSVLRFAHIDAI